MAAEEFAKKTFDYIICGGGTAGLVIAARLSEDPNVTVGVLEAGGNRLGDPLIDAPNLYIQTWDKPEYDWCFKTVPQQGTRGQVHGWVRGKVLGGSSAVNYNMFSMASRQDLDNWAELGNKGWGFDDLAPYYRKFETYNPPSEALSKKINNKYVEPLLRGKRGPIQVSFCEADFQWQQEAWPETCINAGYPVPKDPRSGSALGGFNQPNTVNPKTMMRSYSARDYYEPNAKKPNLSLLTDALVCKLIFEKSALGDVAATGVQFIHNGRSHVVNVNKEVIICGGVVNSPQILELSGIGSPSILHKAGINVIVDNPNVGENLTDHTATGVSFQVKDEYPTAEVLFRDQGIGDQALNAYLEHKTGPFTNPTTTCGFASLNMIDPNLADPEKHTKDLVSKFQQAHPNADPAGRNSLLARQILDPKEAIAQVVLLAIGANLDQKDVPSKLFLHDLPGNWITLGTCSTRSLSRGSVHIESSDPLRHPAIDPAYYSHPLDLDLAARSIMHSITLANYEPLRSKLKLDENGELITSLKNPRKGLSFTLEEAKEIVRANTVTEYHPIGSCAMLPKEKGGVVDSECKVYGTRNVRVVDASIFPTHVQGNIVSLVYAVAEKGADLIRGKTTRTTNDVKVYRARI
ncbi:alcohol oxidase [Lojkania enalia]|uniref:Alcohol oxidase n=1 Tax=Lojkania enalia TaxID=147567 RepID=A0A9P4TRT0_9PLEO|nr:alcohol oxidase [Didymosphaeria enalia]